MSVFSDQFAAVWDNLLALAQTTGTITTSGGAAFSDVPMIFRATSEVELVDDDNKRVVARGEVLVDAADALGWTPSVNDRVAPAGYAALAVEEILSTTPVVRARLARHTHVRRGGGGHFR